MTGDYTEHISILRGGGKVGGVGLYVCYAR